MNEVIRTAPATIAEQAKERFGQVNRGGKLDAAAALGVAVAARRKERPNDTLNALLTWLTDGLEVSISSAYNSFYLYLALNAGYSEHAALMYLYAVGYCLHQSVRPAAELELMDPEAVKLLAAEHKASIRASNAAALAPTREATREALTANVPDAPRHPVEQDALNLEALTVIEAKLPSIYRAAVHAAQTGDVGALDELGEAVRPMGFYTWAKQFGRCWVTGRTPEPGEVFDLHHVQVAGHETRRRDGGQDILVPVSRAAHIPQPFGTTDTAHSSAYSVGNDPAKLTALLEYIVSERDRFGRWERGER